MKFKIAIIDDEEDARALLRIHLERYIHLELVGEASNGKQAIDLIRQQQPDIILLDINMPEMNGLELIQNLEAVPHFIFITAYNEYAIQAFELNAVDYLLKPFSTQRFDAALKRAVERARQGKMEGEIFRRLFQEISQSMDSKSYLQRITYRSGAKTFYLDTTQIVSIEAADQYVNIYTPEKKYLVRQSMDYLEQRLDPSVFFRTHRSFIIRLAAVESMEQFGPRSIWVHLKNGNKVKLSQVRKQLFLDKLRSV